MHDVAEARSGIPEAQPEPRILQQPEARGRERGVAPGAPHVEEHRRAHAEQPKRIPVAEEALLERPERPRGAVLVAQRIAAQPAVAAQQDLVVEVETPAPRGRERREEEPVAALLEVVAHRAIEHPVHERALLEASGEIAREEQRRDPPVREAAAHGALEHQSAAARAERRVRPADTHARRRADVEILGARDLVVVEELQVPILDQPELHPRIEETLVLRDRRHPGPGAHGLKTALVVGDP